MADRGLASYAFLMTQLQGALLERCLPSGENKDAERRELTRSGAKLFQDVVVLLQPDIIVEIGAHEGRFSRLMKRRRPQARVVAFEANPEVFDRHREALSAAGVELVFKCIASENRRFQFHVPVKGEPRLTMGSLMRDTKADSHTTYEVDGVTLDSFLGADAARSNAIWIDVEGAVATILEGAAETLRTCVALYVELETQQRWEGQRLANDIVAQLMTYGLVPVVRDVQRKDWQFNAMFVHASKLSTPDVAQLCLKFVGSQVNREQRTKD